MNSIGYNSEFLGKDYIINLPKMDSLSTSIALNNGEVFDFMHFSLVMNKILKSAIYVASNVDKQSLKNIKRKEYWHFDKKIGEENQIGNNLYKNNQWDRGHLARRKDLCWGTLEEATIANYDSFCWANISLQHKKFNQGIWGKLEDFIYNKIGEISRGRKLSIFTGPINKEKVINYKKSKEDLLNQFIPSGFWKTIFYVDNNEKLKSKSFIIKQDQYLMRDKMCNFDLFLTYQVSLHDIMKITKLEFDPILLKSDDKFTRVTLILKEKDIII